MVAAAWIRLFPAAPVAFASWQLDGLRVEVLEMGFDVDAVAIQERVELPARLVVELEDHAHAVVARACVALPRTQIRRHLLGLRLSRIFPIVLRMSTV